MINSVDQFSALNNNETLHKPKEITLGNNMQHFGYEHRNYKFDREPQPL